MISLRFLFPMLKWFVILAFLLVLIKLILPRLKGWMGEKSLAFVLKRLPKEGFDVLHDIMIRNRGNTTQIDHIVVSVFGIFAIETKTYKGLIYGEESDETWTQVINPHSKFKFRNPLKQNFGHVKALQELLGEKSIYSIVAFADGTFKTEMPPNVMYLRDVPNYILKFHEKVLSPEKVKEIVQLLKEGNITDRGTRRSHVKYVKGLKS